MTDRYAGFVVTLSEDIREDDAKEGVLNAIQMIRGVESVRPILASHNYDAFNAEQRIKNHTRQKLIELIEELR